MLRNVKCDVDSCKYWAQGNRCDADEIFITSHVQEAERVKETDCETFELRH